MTETEYFSEKYWDFDRRRDFYDRWVHLPTGMTARELSALLEYYE